MAFCAWWYVGSLTWYGYRSQRNQGKICVYASATSIQMTQPKVEDKHIYLSHIKEKLKL